MRPGRERALARQQAEELQIRATSVNQDVAELSGGNQQKVVLAKYLARNPRVLLLDEPTRGIDVGTKAEIYQLIRRLTAEGVAVVMVSSEIRTAGTRRRDRRAARGPPQRLRRRRWGGPAHHPQPLLRET